ncbi:MAG: hypothetical protein Q7S22_02550 [Candidatus Micrarchaeota archaeon]|nr:hypothetical protein [Candidatus Micrarchaeota archaeon]
MELFDYFALQCKSLADPYLLDRIFRKKHGGIYFKVYRNEDEFYSFEIPKNWNHVETSDLYGVILSDSQRLEGKFSVKTVESYYQDFDEYSNNLVEAIKEQNGYGLKSQQKLKILSYNALESEFSADAKVGPNHVSAIVKNLLIDDKTRERFVSITFTVLARDYDKYKIIFERVKKSFRFI